MPKLTETPLKEYTGKISNDAWTIIRLDGKGFSKGASAYTRPFDRRFHDVFRVAAQTLMESSPAVLVHTASDEISLVIPPLPAESNWYGQRVSKWLTYSAGLASSILSRNLKLFKGYPSTDGKAFAANNIKEVEDYFIERMLFTRRNWVNGQVYYSLRAKGLSGTAATKAYKTMSGADISGHLPDKPVIWEQFGSFGFYHKVMREGFNPITKQKAQAQRRVFTWREDLTPHNFILETLLAFDT